ncbi:MAG TPA: transcriptional regulator, partial [Spirochaetota bacterium]|nr:transcriptional regulator [Spirochaetota bacterium]
MKKNIALAEDINNVDLQIESKIQLAYLLASIGLYKESVDLLDEISEADLTANLLLAYYSCMEHTYGELSFYSKDPELSNAYWKIADKYKKLQLNILPRDGDLYLSIKESDFRSIRDFKVALEFNDKRLQGVPENSHEYAIITFLRSLIY